MKNKIYDFIYNVHFEILECTVSVHSDEHELISILKIVYGYMLINFSPGKSVLSYTVAYANPDRESIVISRQGISDMTACDLAEFIYLFEKDMTIELQKIRADLLYIHSAALQYKEMGLLIVAPSGTGKSTTTWALVNNGFKYLSDELAPIKPGSLEVMPYPHALCLKSVPPMYELPVNTLVTSKTIHVHGGVLNNAVQMKDVKLKVIFFLDYNPTLTEPVIEFVSNSQSAANIYANSLNILSHSNSDFGLNAAINLVKHVSCFKLSSNQLDKTCFIIKSLMETL